MPRRNLQEPKNQQIVEWPLKLWHAVFILGIAWVVIVYLMLKNLPAPHA